MGYSEPKSSRLGFVAGLVAAERLSAFERLLFRATRGNMYLRSAPVGKVQVWLGAVLRCALWRQVFSKFPAGFLRVCCAGNAGGVGGLLRCLAMIWSVAVAANNGSMWHASCHGCAVSPFPCHPTQAHASYAAHCLPTLLQVIHPSRSLPSPCTLRAQDPASGERIEKVVFVVFFSGDRARTKIMKICEAFGANR